MILEATLGILLGAAGAAAHLWFTKKRAERLVERRGVGVFCYPTALLGPALAVWFAASIAPLAAWLTPLGIFLLRLLVLGRYGRPT